MVPCNITWHTLYLVLDILLDTATTTTLPQNLPGGEDCLLLPDLMRASRLDVDLLDVDRRGRCAVGSHGTVIAEGAVNRPRQRGGKHSAVQRTDGRPEVRVGVGKQGGGGGGSCIAVIVRP